MPSLALRKANERSRCFCCFGILSHGAVGFADRAANGRFGEFLSVEARCDTLRSPVEQVPYADAPVRFALARLIANVSLAEQVVLQKVIHGPRDRRLIVGPPLLGFDLGQAVGRQFQAD